MPPREFAEEGTVGGADLEGEWFGHFEFDLEAEERVQR